MMSHKAYVFDGELWGTEAASLICAALNGQPTALRIFVHQHSNELKHPDTGEEMSLDWTALSKLDAHELGNIAITRYYDPNADVGLGEAWMRVDSLLPRDLRILALGKPLVSGETAFDPGKMGAYFQSFDLVEYNRDSAKLELKHHPVLSEALTPIIQMLEVAIRAKKGLYVTF